MWPLHKALAAKLVGDEGGALVLEDLAAFHMVPVVVGIEHETHRLVCDALDGAVQLLGRCDADRISQDDAFGGDKKKTARANSVEKRVEVVLQPGERVAPHGVVTPLGIGVGLHQLGAGCRVQVQLVSSRRSANKQREKKYA